MTILSSLLCTARRVSEPERLLRVLLCNFYHFLHKTKALQNGEMAVFVPPTSKSTCMHRRSTLVRVSPCLDAQLLMILDFQDAKQGQIQENRKEGVQMQWIYKRGGGHKIMDLLSITKKPQSGRWSKIVLLQKDLFFFF